MVRVLGFGLIGAGVVLCVLGVRAHESSASWVARLLSGSPTKESVMLLAGGGAGVAGGLGLLVVGGRRRGRRRG
ncbi:MAG: DUF3185 family protein [Phycisphaerae bacterium]|nr:DUF3185 family protein [Phycisphaerae bacterium]